MNFFLTGGVSSFYRNYNLKKNALCLDGHGGRGPGWRSESREGSTDDDIAEKVRELKMMKARLARIQTMVSTNTPSVPDTVSTHCNALSV